MFKIDTERYKRANESMEQLIVDWKIRQTTKVELSFSNSLFKNIFHIKKKTENPKTDTDHGTVFIFSNMDDCDLLPVICDILMGIICPSEYPILFPFIPFVCSRYFPVIITFVKWYSGVTNYMYNFIM